MKKLNKLFAAVVFSKLHLYFDIWSSEPPEIDEDLAEYSILIRAQDAYEFYHEDDDGVFKQKEVIEKINQILVDKKIEASVKVEDTEKWWFKITLF